MKNIGLLLIPALLHTLLPAQPTIQWQKRWVEVKLISQEAYNKQVRGVHCHWFHLVKQRPLQVWCM